MLARIVSDEWCNCFPIVYFDNAGRSHQPKSVEQAGLEAIQLKSNPWRGLTGSSEVDIQEMRALYSTLINADGDGHSIAICPSTAFAMSMIAQNILQRDYLHSNESILVLEREMGSVIYPWQNICEQVGCSLRVVPTPNWSVSNASWVSNILDALDDSVRVLSLPNVHWCDGSWIDLAHISQELSRRYVDESQRPLLIVDATQSIGAIPFDVQTIKPDAVACSVHKWLLSPYGTSLVYIDPKHHDKWLPLDHHERARVGSENPAWDEEIFMNGEGFYPKAFYHGARRLDSGGRPNPVWIPMIRSGLQLLHRLTVPSISQHLSKFCDILHKKIVEYPNYEIHFTVAPKEQRAGHILGLRFADIELLRKVHQTLKEHQIYTSIRGSCLRISPYLGNTIADANLFQSIFFQALKLHTKDSATNNVRVLITGACGWLAQSTFRRLLNYANDFGLEIYGTYRSTDNTKKIPHWILHSHRVIMDLSSPESVSSVIEQIKPDIVLHLAALSSPVECHKNPAFARLINAPVHLIEAVERFVPSSLFLFASTDMVYDGETPPYTVSTDSSLSNTNAVNIYGASKQEMETMVSRLKYGVSLRLSNMIGTPYVYQAVGEKFLQFLSQQLEKRNSIGLKEDEIRSFVYVEDVVQVMIRLIRLYLAQERQQVVALTTEIGENIFLDTNILNIGGPKPFSRLELAELLAQLSNISLVVTNDASEAATSKDSLSPEANWVVYRMPATTAPDIASVCDWSSISSTPLRSPRNIAMDSSSTEHLLNFTFTPLEKILVSSTGLS